MVLAVSFHLVTHLTRRKAVVAPCIRLMLALALLFRLVKELVERDVLDVADRAIVHAMWALPIWPMLAKQFLGHFLALLLVNRLRAIEALSLWSMHAFPFLNLDIATPLTSCQADGSSTPLPSCHTSCSADISPPRRAGRTALN